MAASSGFGNNIFTSATRVLVGDRNSFIHKFDQNKMTDALKDTAWRARYGGAKKSKFDGAKDAIEEIVTDSSLTSGANYSLVLGIQVLMTREVAQLGFKTGRRWW